MADINHDVWQPVEPKGLAFALVIVTAIFVVLTTLVMTMRIYIRLKTHNFGTDDWVMTAGYIINLGQSAITIYGAHTGLGTRDDNLPQATIIEGTKFLLIWQALYAGSLAFIKSSICITLMRITQQRGYLILLRSLVILSAGLSSVGLVVILNQCHPLSRYWDKSIPGTCWPPILATVLSYAASVSNVITDFTVAITPYFLLRHVQLRRRLKVYVKLILGLGMLAGIASIIRVPFTNAYLKPSDINYHTGHIILWTIVECGLGIIAGSLPTLRAFFKRLSGDQSTQDYMNNNNNPSDGTGLVTIGQIKGRHGPHYEADLCVTVAGGGGDGGSDAGSQESQRGIIKMTRDVMVTEEHMDADGKVTRMSEDVRMGGGSGEERRRS
ncbi:hypothetical protein QBC38DRAFT_89084 [Podospora fimiseda]|uniref:Rhodopsin domain-containing protein n=1 Tax=Podospora fimiseda TaxID=252190 RepID=A0AAN6YPQ0_9PEZI|nr:hypothetical protein QBC38DRAFT_89084 [Podospora fimiseda]